MQFFKQALLGTLLASTASAVFASPPHVQKAAATPAPTAAVAASGAAASAVAASAVTGAEAAQTANGAMSALPLSAYTHTDGPMRLAGESASGALTVSVSPREAVRSALLHLVATNSVSVLSPRSQLAVRLDDRTVAQFPLSPLQPELAAEIRIPVALLRPGYNTLSFAAAAHATSDCEEKDSPELWTEIDTRNSTLQLQTELKALNPATLTLADANDLIDPRQSTLSPLAIVVAAHPKTDTQLATGGLLAQGVALRLRYLNATLQVRDAQAGTGTGILPGLAPSTAPGADVMLVGTREQLARYVDKDMAAKITGAFLGLYPKPDDPRHFVLVVSGRDDAEVNLAARTFAHAEIPLPRQRDMVVQSFPGAAAQNVAATNVLRGTGAFSFRDLGLRSTTLNAGDTASLQVRLPGDVYAAEDAQVNLTLNFAEGAKMRSDSVLNVYLNGQFERTVALDQQQGAVVSHYQMPIPLRHFRAGENTVTLRPVMVPLITDRCTLRQSGNLQLSIFDDSTIRLPAVSHFAELPDLKLFAATGFPYTAKGTGSALALQIAPASNDTAAAAWMLAGKLAQDLGHPLMDVQITGGTPDATRHTIVLGAQSDLPDAAFAGAPWLPGKTIRVPVNRLTARGNDTDTGWWSRLTGQSDASPVAKPDAPVLQMTGSFPLSRQLVVMQYRGATGTTSTMVTAATQADLANGMAKLIDAQNWSRLEGDVAVVGPDSASLWTARVGPRYDIGKIDALGRLGYDISQHPVWGYTGVVACLLALAALTSVLLLRYKRKHHGKSSDE